MTILQYFKHIIDFLIVQPFRTVTTPSTSTKWTDDEVAELLAFRANGMSIADIALQLNRSESSVYQKLRRLNKSKRKPNV